MAKSSAPSEVQTPTPQEEGKPLLCDKSDLNDTMWKIIGRYDTYMGSVNTKATLLIAFNTFLLGSVILKGQDVAAIFGSHSHAVMVVYACLFIMSITSLLSMGYTFQAVTPFLDSPREPTTYHSIIFFEHVAEHSDESKYHTAITGLTDGAIITDLSSQAHALARGLRSKFRHLRTAFRIILRGQLPAIGVIATIWFICNAMDVMDRMAAR
jgi:uncharacterized membrane protein YuzA (DUF378 family)